MVSGFWRSDDLQGHFKFEIYDDSGVRERRREVSEEGPFHAELLANTRETVVAGLRSAQAKREAVAVEASPISLDSILEFVQRGGVEGAVVKAGASVAGGKQHEGEADKESSSDGDDDDEVDEHNRLANLFGNRSASAKPKRNAKGQAASAASAKGAARAKQVRQRQHKGTSHGQGQGQGFPSAGPQGADAGSLSPASAASPASAGAAIAELDGRFARMKAAAKQDAADIRTSLGEVSFHEDFRIGTKDGWSNLQHAVAARTKILTQIMAQIRSASLRLSRSRHQDHLEPEREELENLSDMTQKLVQFNTSVRPTCVCHLVALLASLNMSCFCVCGFALVHYLAHDVSPWFVD